MRHRRFVALWCALLLLFGCQNTELPTEDEAADEQTESSSSDTETLLSEALSVSELIETYEGEDLDQTYTAAVAGYIVGVCKSSISNAFFTAAEIAAIDVSSNMLIADSKDETDVDNCVPVELEYGTDFRSEVNLADNPDNLGRRIYLSGFVEEYFSVVGLKSVQNYQWLDDEEEDADDETVDSDDNDVSDETDDNLTDESADTDETDSDSVEEETIIDDADNEIIDSDQDDSETDDDTDETNQEIDTLVVDSTHVIISGGRLNKHGLK